MVDPKKAKMRKDAKAHMKAVNCSKVITDPPSSLDEASVTSHEPQLTPAESTEANIVDDCAMPEELRSETSPYTTPIITLSIGVSSTKYTLHEGFLSQSPELAKHTPISSWRNTIELPEVNEDVGHTLVHYLYTGTYQILKLPSVSQDARTIARYKRSVNAYFLAKKFGLKGLEVLAERQVACCDGEVSIFDVLDATKEVHQQLSGDGIWLLDLKDYLKKELQAAFRRDETVFATEEFLDRVGNNKEFSRALMKSVVDIYTEKIVSTAKNAENESAASVSPPVDLEPAKTVWIEEAVDIKRVEEPAYVNDFARVGEPDPAEELACEDEPTFMEKHHCMEKLAYTEEPKPREELPCWEYPAFAEEPPCAEEVPCWEDPACEEPEREEDIVCVDEPAIFVTPTHVYPPWGQSKSAFSKAPIARSAGFTVAEPEEATPIADLPGDRTESLPTHLLGEEDKEDPREVKDSGTRSDEFGFWPRVQKTKGKRGKKNSTVPDFVTSF